jgi:hypothetical protein
MEARWMMYSAAAGARWFFFDSKKMCVEIKSARTTRVHCAVK